MGWVLGEVARSLIRQCNEIRVGAAGFGFGWTKVEIGKMGFGE